MSQTPPRPSPSSRSSESDSDDDVIVDVEFPSAPDFFEAPTGRSVVLTLRGRLESKLDELPPLDQDRALKLLSDWIACGTEKRHALCWLARLLAKE